MFPASLLEYLHVQPRSQVDYVLADGSEVTYERGRRASALKAGMESARSFSALGGR